MTNLNTRSALHPRWTKAALRALEAFEVVTIAIFAPNNAKAGPSDFDPWASRRGGGEAFGFGEGAFGQDSFGGVGGSANGNATQKPTLLWEGRAQMQVYRQSLTVDDVAGSVTQLRSVRFTMSLEDTQFIIRKGMIVRVLATDYDSQDIQYEYTITSAANSGLAWKRTIEAETDMMVVAPPITDHD